MDEDPDEPRRQAAEVQAADVGHRLVAADDGQNPLVFIAEGRHRLGRAPAAQHVGHELPLLHGHLGHAGQRFAVLLEVGQVADDEDVGVAGQRQIRPDDEAAGAILLRAGALGDDRAQRRGAHARAPEYSEGRDARLAPGGVPDHDVVGGDVGNHHAGTHLDTQSCQRARRRLRQPRRKAGQDAIQPFDEENRRLGRVEAAELAGQGVAGQIAQRPRQLHAGRPAADDDEGQQGAAAVGVGFALGSLEGQQDAPPDGDGVFDRLQAGGQR